MAVFEHVEVYFAQKQRNKYPQILSQLISGKILPMRPRLNVLLESTSHKCHNTWCANLYEDSECTGHDLHDGVLYGYKYHPVDRT